MIFKPFKINKLMFSPKVCVQLFWNMSDKGHFEALKEMLHIVGLSFPLKCEYSFDKERLIVNKTDAGIEIEILKPRKVVRVIKLQRDEIVVETDVIFNQLLRLANEHDALLFISSENSGSEVLINDNGRDFIHFDKTQFVVKDVKDKFNQILSRQRTKEG